MRSSRTTIGVFEVIQLNPCRCQYQSALHCLLLLDIPIDLRLIQPWKYPWSGEPKFLPPHWEVLVDWTRTDSDVLREVVKDFCRQTRYHLAWLATRCSHTRPYQQVWYDVLDRNKKVCKWFGQKERNGIFIQYAQHFMQVPGSTKQGFTLRLSHT